MKALKKKPIQIYIDAGQDNLLQILSKKRGVSKAAIIRESIDRLLIETPLEEDPAMELVGMGSSGKGDISKKHDLYLVKYIDRREK